MKNINEKLFDDELNIECDNINENEFVEVEIGEEDKKNIPETIVGLKNIFKYKYIIPIYQRAFAWKDEEITKLLEDIHNSNKKYYIGSLVVNYNQNNNEFEVIDGQQRLTTIYLLLNYLNVYFEKHNISNKIAIGNELEFEARKKSSNTLKKDVITKIVESIIGGTSYISDNKEINNDIMNGIKVIHNYFEQNKNKEEFIKTFIEKIDKVILFKILVPENTDLNRYFEVMNTRGEQLLQSDIVKAKFMEKLDNNFERELFSIIWNACLDMTGYVQMHFDIKLRKILFGENWDTIQWEKENISESQNDFDYLISKINKTDDEEKPITFKNIKFEDNSKIERKISFNDIINDNYENYFSEDREIDDKYKNLRFESIINFDYFLLHTLKIMNDNIIFDDKKLIENFKNVKDKPKEYIMLLLKMRFLFDKYIVKREYTLDEKNGKWSLRMLKADDGKGRYVITSEDENFDVEDNDENNIAKNLLMIESALRVTYTSNMSMEWIDKIFEYFIENGDKKLEKVIGILENYANEKVKEFVDGGNYNIGVSTPHIVFNYLDYLLWKKEKNKDFVFEFRNSVEHWYPQNPDEEHSFEKWEGNDESSCDMFGNLCLVSSEINSKFSNASPKSKKEYIGKIFDKQSLKLQVMSTITDKFDLKEWKNSKCAEHQEKMIEILKNSIIMES